MAYAAVHEDVTPPCSARYPAATEFSLTSETGQPMTPAELQARTGSESRGLLENASVVKRANAPSPAVLEVHLADQSGSETASGGIGFRWAPGGLESAGSACLRYRVWLPKGFKFGDAGVLPGLFGGDPAGEKAFVSRLVWSREGKGGIGLEVPGSERGNSKFIKGHDFNFDTEQWIKIEQELRVNSPGGKDGIIRLWVDGNLVVEQTNVVLRSDVQSSIRGVVGDVGYGSSKKPKDGTQSALSLTPLTVSWR
jgi:hypothetical protein